MREAISFVAVEFESSPPLCAGDFVITEKLPHIASLWIGSRLGWMERLTYHSFVARGHEVTLFTTEHVENVPEGIEVLPVGEIFEPPEIFKGKVAEMCIADIFRLYLMQKTDMVWVDADALCYRPFTLNDGYLCGWIPNERLANNGVLRIPKTSPVVRFILDHFENAESIPPWIRRRHRKRLARHNVSTEELLPTLFRVDHIAFGPRALTYAMEHFGETGHLHAPDVLFPIPWFMSDIFFNPHGGVEGWLSEQSMSVHLYSSQVRRQHRGRKPHPDSFMARFAADVGFDLEAEFK